MIEKLIERVQELITAPKRDEAWGIDVKQTREELAAEQARAEEMLDQLAEAEYDLDIAESDAEGENNGA